MSQSDSNILIGHLIQSFRQTRNQSQEGLSSSLQIPLEDLKNIESGNLQPDSILVNQITEQLSLPESRPKSIDFEVTGGQTLSGSIKTNYSKNGAMGLLCASLLNSGQTTLHGIPRIEEVNRMLEIMESVDINCNWTGPNTLVIKMPSKLNLDKLNRQSAIKTRSIIMFIGSLIHILDNFAIPHAQGCDLGKRTINPHFFALQELGVKIKVTDNDYLVTSPKKTNNSKRSTPIVMYEASDTGAEIILMAAARIPGRTIIKFTSANYMVQEVCLFLVACGVRVEGIGSSTLIVHGVAQINQEIEYHNSEDPIESMMLISAAICTNSELLIQACPIDFLSLELLKLSKMGFKYKLGKVYKAANGWTNLVDITTLAALDSAKPYLQSLPDKISCGPYPAINIDNLPFFVPIAAMATGTTLIHDWVFENRAIYFTELNRLGAKISLADPHRVFVEGPTKFKAAQVTCPPALRPAMIILIGMMAAEGTSTLHNVYSIERGYEDIANRLNQIGAKIRVLK